MLNQSDIKRFPPLSGGVNFRDIGGYETEDGRRVRWNQVYRSGTLAEIDEDGLGQLTELGIGTVFDLRSAEERHTAVSNLPPSITNLHVPVKDPSSFARLRILQILLFRRDNLADVLYDAYTRVMLDGNGRTLGQILEQIASVDAPVMVHCTAGKDRTGLTIALLLSILGVPRETIIADYAVSGLFEAKIAERLDGDLRALRRLRLRDEQIRPLLQANPDLLRRVFNYIDDRYGSVERYLIGECELSSATMQQLKSRLIVDVAAG